MRTAGRRPPISAPPLRLLGSLLACLILATTTTALAQAVNRSPGDLISLEHYRHWGQGEINTEVGGRFRNDGETPPSANTAVDVYLLSFATTAPDGALTSSVAQLYLPATPTDQALLAFGPGSTGLPARCGPMQELLNTGRGGTYGASALAYAGQGLATVLPDYLATLQPGDMQPYFVATAEAAVLIDALRASQQALLQLSSTIVPLTHFMAGFSQGGHAVFAAADRASTYAPDLPIGGVLGFGPSGQVEVLFRHFQYTAPWVVWAYMHAYPGAVDAHDVLAPAYANELDQAVRDLCILEAQGRYPSAPSSLYTEAFYAALDSGTLAQRFPAWAQLFAANDTGVREHGIPVMILQGVDDPIVPLADQTAFVNRLCELGAPVRYANYLRTRHETRYIGFGDALSWMRERMAGIDAPSDCQEVMP